jgi:D-arabinose 1-dehydrogenase-like Zn-dependent alcohol dehydrogenase
LTTGFDQREEGEPNMRAVAFTDFGAAPALTDLPVPEPGPGEVLVRVRASSVNGFDLGVLGGFLKGVYEHEFPVVLGKDFAGVVTAVGEGGTAGHRRLHRRNPRQARHHDLTRELDFIAYGA